MDLWVVFWHFAADPSLVSNSHLPAAIMVQEFLIFCSHHDHGPRVSPRCSARSLLRMIGQGTHLSPKAMTVPGRADQKFGTILSPLIMYIAHANLWWDSKVVQSCNAHCIDWRNSGWLLKSKSKPEPEVFRLVLQSVLLLNAILSITSV